MTQSDMEARIVQLEELLLAPALKFLEINNMAKEYGQHATDELAYHNYLLWCRDAYFALTGAAPAQAGEP